MILRSANPERVPANVLHYLNARSWYNFLEIKPVTYAGPGQQGVFTSRDLKVNKVVCEYEGEVVTGTDAIRRETVREEEEGESGSSYIFYVRVRYALFVQ